jgi:hypothetical protein
MARHLYGGLLFGIVALAACGGSPALHPTPGAAGTSGGGTGGAAGDGAVDPAGPPGTAGATATAGATGSAEAVDAAPEADAVAVTEPTDAGADATTDVMVDRLAPPSDGPVSIINSSNWNETTLYPFSKRRMLVRDQGNSRVVLLDFSRPDPVVWNTVAGGAWARALQLIGNNQVMGGRNDGYEVFDLTTGAIVKSIRTFANTQSAYRMANGETMLTTSGTVLKFLDKDDQQTRTIAYPGYGFVRVARPTRNGTFLVPSDMRVFEGDADGKVLWSASGSGWAHVEEALLMGDGNVVVGTFFGASLDILDKTTHLVTKRYSTKDLPAAATYHANAFREVQILPNGNLITANWQGLGGKNGGSGVQVIEFNPAGEVVWSYKQDPAVFSSISGVLVIDGMNPQYLHVQETSADSTWQPVIPPPMPLP